jgi:hypothetical protein
VLHAAHAILHGSPDSSCSIRVSGDACAAHVANDIHNRSDLFRRELNRVKLVGGGRNAPRGGDLASQPPGRAWEDVEPSEHQGGRANRMSNLAGWSTTPPRPIGRGHGHTRATAVRSCGRCAQFWPPRSISSAFQLVPRPDLAVPEPCPPRTCLPRPVASTPLERAVNMLRRRAYEQVTCSLPHRDRGMRKRARHVLGRSQDRMQSAR